MTAALGLEACEGARPNARLAAVVLELGQEATPLERRFLHREVDHFGARLNFAGSGFES